MLLGCRGPLATGDKLSTGQRHRQHRGPGGRRDGRAQGRPQGHAEDRPQGWAQGRNEPMGKATRKPSASVTEAAAAPVRLVAFDLDGTFLDDRGVPPADAAAAVRRLLAGGVYAAAISGRSVRRSLQALAPLPDLAERLYLCGYNGGVTVEPVADGHRRLVHVERLPAESLRQLAEYAAARGLDLVYCRCDECDGHLVEEYRYSGSLDGRASTADWRGPGYVQDPGLVARLVRGELPPAPKAMLFVPAALSEQIAAELHSRLCPATCIAWADPELLEIMPAGVDKGVALARLAAALHVLLAETLAIGDGNNDLPMLQRAGRGLLMGSAAAPVRAAARAAGIQLVPPLADGGFAAALQLHVPQAAATDEARAGSARPASLLPDGPSAPDADG